MEKKLSLQELSSYNSHNFVWFNSINKNFKLLQLEMDEKLKKTNFGKETIAIPVDRLGILFAVLFSINAIIQIVTIYN